MTDMADVLKQHSDWLWSTERGEVICAGCDWAARPGLTGSSADTFAAHQAAALSAAGFGLVADAKREAWAAGYEQGWRDGQRAEMTDEDFGPHRNNPYREDSNACTM